MSTKPYVTSPLVRPTSSLAVVGFILSLTVIGFLPGIVLGLLALRVTRTGERDGNGLAVAAIVIGVISLLWMAAWLIFGVTLMHEFKQQYTPNADPAAYTLD